MPLKDAVAFKGMIIDDLTTFGPTRIRVPQADAATAAAENMLKAYKGRAKVAPGDQPKQAPKNSQSIKFISMTDEELEAMSVLPNTAACANLVQSIADDTEVRDRIRHFFVTYEGGKRGLVNRYGNKIPPEAINQLAAEQESLSVTGVHKIVLQFRCSSPDAISGWTRVGDRWVRTIRYPAFYNGVDLIQQLVDAGIDKSLGIESRQVFSPAPSIRVDHPLILRANGDGTYRYVKR